MTHVSRLKKSGVKHGRIILCHAKSVLGQTEKKPLEQMFSAFEQMFSALPSNSDIA
jgi:hypothetical protein